MTDTLSGDQVCPDISSSSDTETSFRGLIAKCTCAANVREHVTPA